MKKVITSDYTSKLYLRSTSKIINSMFNICWVWLCLFGMQNFIRMIQYLNDSVVVFSNLLNYVSHTPSRITCLCVPFTFLSYVVSRLTRPLPLVPCVSYLDKTKCTPYLRTLRAFIMRHARLIYALCAPSLCTLKSFKDGFIVHQKVSVFQVLLKALQTALFLCGSKNSHEIF